MTGAGAAPGLNRVIRLAGSPGRVRGALEDDYHHFRVDLRHDGARVTAVTAEALRNPFSLCGAAGRQLEEIVGMALSPDMTAAFRTADARLQCTHQFDLAALAVTAAARGTVSRRYDVRVTDPVPGQPRRAMLSRDGAAVLAWTLDDYAVADPPPYAGRSLGSGFTGWVAEALSPDEAEAALVLRRGVFIAKGRPVEIRRTEMMPVAPATGGCWVQQPERAPMATRVYGTTLDFGDSADLLTRDDEDWLAA